MEAYHAFAAVYDRLMEEIPYEDWCGYVTGLLAEQGIQDGLLLELGCGTGTMTELFAARGFDMIGVDNSEEMLAQAMEKEAADPHGILYLLQDMRELDLYSTIGTVVSLCDSLNYLLTTQDLEKTFRLVKNFLYPGGIFIFDFNTVYKYAEVIGDATIAENREDCSFIWENYYYPEECINEYDVTVFVEEEEDLYRKFTETHYQRGYTLAEMEELVTKAGMSVIEALDADTKGPVRPDSERIYIIAGKSGADTSVQN